VWIFDAIANSWLQPNKDHNDEAIKPFQLTNTFWANVPPPRASHSATLVGNSIYIFGGYGGSGYSRRDLDDLYALDTVSWIWSKILCKGTAPEKRSSHQACGVGPRIYIMGGCSSSGQYQDVYSLETDQDPPLWSKLQCSLPAPTWNFAACAVLAIPTWKIFTFGGVTGRLSDLDRQGTLVNSTSIFDTGINRFIYPKGEGSIPSPRSDSCLAYDAKGSRLLVFGGWSEKWQSDLYSMHVGDIVGPPYAIIDILPKMGPITGGTEITLIGIDLIKTTDVTVRFGNFSKNYIDVVGTYISKTQITVISPDFQKIPPGDIDVRIALNGDSFTTTFQKFSVFSVTNAKYCIMYGPGLLNGCAINEEISFLIQARDDSKTYRTTGGDEFKIVVEYLGAGLGDVARLGGVTTEDLKDGRYIVTYMPRHPGKYRITVDFLGTFGGLAGPLRGTDTTITFDEHASRECNMMAGEIVIKSLKEDVEHLKRFTQDISSNIFVRVKDDSWSSEEQIRVLMNVKEALLRAESQSSEINILIDRSDCVVQFLAEQDVVIGE
jgi:dynein heavy chain